MTTQAITEPTTAPRDASAPLNEMCWLVDRRDWSSLRALLDDTVTVDYTELFGGQPAVFTADDLVCQWRDTLTALDSTHHAVTSPVAVTDGRGTAFVRANVTAAHRRRIDGDEDQLWTVGGHYAATVRDRDGQWRISELTLHVSWQSGQREMLTGGAGQDRR